MTEAAQLEYSAGGILYRRRPEGLELLVIRDRYGNWGLPKGHVEAGEAPAEAALRECGEETGLDHLRPGPHVGRIDWTFRRGARLIHKFCDFYLLEAPADAEPRPQQEEGISQAVWLPATTALERIAYENTREITRQAIEALTRGPESSSG